MDLYSLGRIPPHNIEAEQSVLGSMLLDNDKIPDIISIIKSDDFYKDIHREIYNSIDELFNKNEPVDIISVSENLDSRGVLNNIGGLEYLSTISTGVPTTANAKHYASIVEEKSVRRKTIKISNEIINRAYDGDFENVVDIKSNSLELLSAINVNDKKSKKNLKSIAVDFKEKIKRKKNQSNDGEEKYYTGISDFDNWLDGLHEQEFSIIGARPSCGKTAIAMQIALNLAKRGLHVTFDTLEMSDEQLFSRVVSSQGKINSHKLRKPKLMSIDDWNAFEKAVDEASDLPLYIEEIRYIQDLRAYCRNMKTQNKLDVLFVDYLQLMLTYKKTNNRTEELGDISRNLKALSKEFNIPIVALAQLTRLTERESREPRLSDLRECGDMEQDADNVIFIHKPSGVDDLVEIQDRKVIIAKQRNGATGYFNMMFEGKTFNFISIVKDDKNKKTQSIFK